MTEEELLYKAYALEKKSEHPLARAILTLAEERKLSSSRNRRLSGSSRKWPHRKPGTEQKLAGGNLSFISKESTVSGQLSENRQQPFQRKVRLRCSLAENGHLMGIIAVADVIKEDSPRAIQELKNMGIHVVMLTGDNERTARAIGKQAGVDEVVAGVLPDGKEAVIRELKKKGRVAMVGDGINDAPALTRADIGIAIGAGTDIAIDAADVVLMKSRLSDVPAAIRLSRATLRNIHENLFWAFILQYYRYSAGSRRLDSDLWLDA